MMLIEDTSVRDEALPAAAFKAHLRLGTGFSEDGLQDAVLLGFLRAAIAAIESRTGKVLISRTFSWTLNSWRDPMSQVLPVAPVTGLIQVTLANFEGVESDVALNLFRLEQDSQRPRIRPVTSALPLVPPGGTVCVRFQAGFATTWDGLPADLAQAVLLLAAHYYEYRHETSLSEGCMPFGVSSLIQRYRPMRITPRYSE